MLAAEKLSSLKQAAGWQKLRLAPTEILSRQHFARISVDLAKFGIETALLVSGLKAAERRSAWYLSGDIDIIVGTHALIQSDVEFARSG